LGGRRSKKHTHFGESFTQDSLGIEDTELSLKSDKRKQAALGSGKDMTKEMEEESVGTLDLLQNCKIQNDQTVEVHSFWKV
jgi:hypothetical protein